MSATSGFLHSPVKMLLLLMAFSQGVKCVICQKKCKMFCLFLSKLAPSALADGCTETQMTLKPFSSTLHPISAYVYALNFTFDLFTS